MGMSSLDLKEVMEEWLVQAENPTSRMEAELNTAKEKIKQLEHEINKMKKTPDLQEQEEVIKVDKLEKIPHTGDKASLDRCG